MNYAWNPLSISPASVPTYVQMYAQREFGDDHANEIAAILLEYSRLVGYRRFGSMDPAA